MRRVLLLVLAAAFLASPAACIGPSPGPRPDPFTPPPVPPPPPPDPVPPVPPPDPVDPPEPIPDPDELPDPPDAAVRVPWSTWRTLRVGMTRTEVDALFGKAPVAATPQDDGTTIVRWKALSRERFARNLDVQFAAAGTVMSWFAWRVPPSR